LEKRYDLISIDLDGTITSVITEEFVLKKLAPDRLEEYLRLDKELMENYDRFEELTKKQFELLIGLEVDVVKEVIRSAPLTKNIVEAVKEMKEDGFKVIILTDNIDVFCEAIMETIPFDNAISSQTIRRNNKIVGLGKLNLRKEEGLKEFVKKEKIDLSRCIHIGDWRNDIPVFNIVGLSIAFCPKDPEVIRHAALTFNIDDFLILYKIIREITYH